MCAPSLFKQYKGSFTTALGQVQRVEIGVQLFEKYITQRGSTGIDFALDWMGFPIRFTAYMDSGMISGIKQWQMNKYQDPQIAGIAMAAARTIIPTLDLTQLPDKDWDKVKAKKAAGDAVGAKDPKSAMDMIKQRAKEAAGKKA